METDRRVLPFSDIRTEANLASALGLELAFLLRVAQRNDSGEAEVRLRKKKIRGKSRIVQEPRDEELKQTLNSVVHSLALTTATLLRSSSLVHGYVPSRSAFTNAKAHVQSRFAQKLDIRNFFASIDCSMIAGSFQHLGMGSRAAMLLTRVVSRDGHLPLGYASSPLVSNLVMVRLDVRLLALSEERGLTVTRYADDVTFSADDAFDISVEFAALLGDFGFEVNESKTTSGRLSDGMHITGFTVAGETPRLPRRLKRMVRQDLFHICRIGMEEQAKARGRTPESFARRMSSRLGLLRATEPSYHAQLVERFPLALQILEDRRLLSQERKKRRRERLAKELLASPSQSPTFYLPSVSYNQTEESAGGESDPATPADGSGSSAWDLV